MLLKKIIVYFIIGYLSIFWLFSCKKGEAITADDAVKKSASVCTPHDQKIAIYPKNEKFKKIMDKCSTNAWGNGPKTKECLKKKYPQLSEGCADCYGKMASCGASNCKWKCFSNHFSEGCLACVNTHCREGKTFNLLRCTGLKVHELP